MATLMRAVNPGHYDRRCDSKCHNARLPECDCLCGGRYHGKGLSGELGGAIEEFAEEVFEKARARFPEVEDYTKPVKEQKTLWDIAVKPRSAWDVPVKPPSPWDTKAS